VFLGKLFAEIKKGDPFFDLYTKEPCPFGYG